MQVKNSYYLVFTPARICSTHMRSIALLALLFSLAFPSYAQDSEPDSTSAVPFIAYWQEGDEILLEYVNGTRKYAGDSLVSADSSTTRYRVTILAETDSSYTIRWRGEDFATTQNLLDGVSVDDSLQSAICETGIVIETDALGKLIRIVNMNELIALTRSMLNSTFEKLKSTPGIKQGAKDFIDNMRSDEVLAFYIRQPIETYYSLYGVQYYTDSTRSFGIELPVAWGGNPVPAICSFSASWLDEQTGYILMETDADPDAMKGRVIEHLRRIEALQGDSLPDEVKGARVEMKDLDEYYIDTESGWIFQIDHLRLTTVFDQLDEKFWHFRIVE